jgi:ubiquinone/menaquinone biosynthesis C-methylase UbiE
MMTVIAEPSHHRSGGRSMPYTAFANQEFRNFFQTHLEIPTLVRAISIPPRSRILEIGCGRGIALPRLAQLCSPSRLVGIDIDPVLVNHAEKRLRRHGVDAEVRVADARELPFDDREFDVVIDFGTCYHIDEPERALREIDRVLDLGGIFIHETPLAQVLAHPIRTTERGLPWHAAFDLKPDRSAVLWASRMKSHTSVSLHLQEA